MTREHITKQFARYTVSEIEPGIFTAYYTLIKNGSLWGTFYHCKNNATEHWTENGNHRMRNHVYRSRAAVDAMIKANEERLAARRR